MGTTVVVAVAVGLMIAANAPKATPIEEPREELDGIWVVESVVRDPPERDADEAQGVRCIIAGETLVVKLPGDDKARGWASIHSDARQKPKALDITPDGEKEPVLAIYELDGDTLLVCWGPPGKGRVTELSSEPGSGQSLIVLKREKPSTGPGR